MHACLLAGFGMVASLGYGTPSPETQDSIRIIGKIGLLMGFVVSFINAFRRGSIVSTTVGGFLAGFGWSVGLVSIALYGLTFP